MNKSFTSLVALSKRGTFVQVLMCLLICNVVFMTTLSTNTASAQACTNGPITFDECFIINPQPQIFNCSIYDGNASLYTSLPWNYAPYQSCVQQRCICSEPSPNITIQTNGIYCVGDNFTESGFVTCNDMVDCYRDFWRCATNTLMNRIVATNLPVDMPLTPSEQELAAAIVQHGRAQGESFQSSSVFKSCQKLTCEAAASRQCCGLITCEPNYTQCYEYLVPPRTAFVNQKCTTGCQVGLLLMALTIASVCFSFCCCCCCPPRVRVIDPLLKNGNNNNLKPVNSGKEDG